VKKAPREIERGLKKGGEYIEHHPDVVGDAIEAMPKTKAVPKTKK
jgi:hypothetical protein